jgi:hypothetical protein
MRLYDVYMLTHINEYNSCLRFELRTRVYVIHTAFVHWVRKEGAANCKGRTGVLKDLFLKKSYIGLASTYISIRKSGAKAGKRLKGRVV